MLRQQQTLCCSMNMKNSLPAVLCIRIEDESCSLLQKPSVPPPSISPCWLASGSSTAPSKMNVYQTREGNRTLRSSWINNPRWHFSIKSVLVHYDLINKVFNWLSSFFKPQIQRANIWWLIQGVKTTNVFSVGGVEPKVLQHARWFLFKDTRWQ